MHESHFIREPLIILQTPCVIRHSELFFCSGFSRNVIINFIHFSIYEPEVYLNSFLELTLVSYIIKTDDCHLLFSLIINSEL
jgi:hypothetical protein